MKSKILQWIAIALILVTGFLHFISVPEEYAEAPYMGWLFIANAVGALVSAVGIYRQKIWWGWALGIFITAGSILGYILSRTIGMPGMEVEPWANLPGILGLVSGGKSLGASVLDVCGKIYDESRGGANSYGLTGFVAMSVETLFLGVLALAKPWLVPGMDRDLAAFNSTVKRLAASRYFYPAIMLAMLVVGIFSYQLGVRNAAAKHNSEHPLPETVITAETLEQEYGIQMTLVGLSAAGGLVDVRYKVIDPAKAARLATEDGIMPMIYVQNTDVMLMPDAHMRTQKLIAGRMYFSLIPNAQNVVRRGTSVIVVFGDVALEPIITQ